MYSNFFITMNFFFCLTSALICFEQCSFVSFSYFEKQEWKIEKCLQLSVNIHFECIKNVYGWDDKIWAELSIVIIFNNIRFNSWFWYAKKRTYRYIQQKWRDVSIQKKIYFFWSVRIKKFDKAKLNNLSVQLRESIRSTNSLKIHAFNLH